MVEIVDYCGGGAVRNDVTELTQDIWLRLTAMQDSATSRGLANVVLRVVNVLD
jgi:hypothetical protein